MSTTGYLSAADTLLFADNLARVFRAAQSVLPAVLTAAQQAQLKIAGDGGANAGLASVDLKATLKGTLPSLNALFDITRVWGSQNGLVAACDNAVRSNLPQGWNFTTLGATLTHPLDLHAARLNGSWAAPVTGAANPVAGTLTAQNNAQGTLPNCIAANCPRVVHTLVGAADYNESLPSGEAAQVAVSGSQNALVYQIAGNVPAGITKVRIYKGLVGGPAGVYGWSKDVSASAGVVPGAPYPAIPLVEPDAFLRFDLVPPAWLCALFLPEFAALFALANSGSGFGSGAQTTLTLPVQMTPLAMLSAGNVVLNPSSAFLGIGNPASSGVFGTSTVTGSGAQTYAAGLVQKANNPQGNVQGFAGALALQSRVVSALGGAATFTLTYTYYDQAHGWGVVQTADPITSAHVTGAVGETIALPLPAGRIVQSVTVTSVSGAATTGSVVLEAALARN